MSGPDSDDKAPPRPPEDPGHTFPLQGDGQAGDRRPPCEDTDPFLPQSGRPPQADCRAVPPELIDHPRYRVLDYLGSGGMGTVFKARHLVMDRLVALKIISPDLVGRPAMVDRFRREVKAAARLSHPNIVTAFDADQAGETHFLVMELVEGVDLDFVLRAGPLAIERACDYARQAALGLQHAWEQGMVHRDIKPHNLMLTPHGQVKILDFGLARFVSEAVAAGAGGASKEVFGSSIFKGTAYTYAGAGTADYVAPEEAVDARRADIRADIYSLGCTLYRCLSGRVPFPDGDLAAKVQAHLERLPEPLHRLRGELPSKLVQAVQRMMAKDPEQRFGTPAEVARVLAPFATAAARRPILIVDDDAVTRLAMALVFEVEGYTVAFAGNGAEALERLRQGERPSLILLDLLMPVMDGWEFLRQQKEDPQLADIPVIIISATNAGHARAIALGAADYLQKPLEPEELTSRVHSITPPPT